MVAVIVAAITLATGCFVGVGSVVSVLRRMPGGVFGVVLVLVMSPACIADTVVS